MSNGLSKGNMMPFKDKQIKPLTLNYNMVQ